MKRKNSGGFTLVEIMIVVLIIALLAAIAVPSFMRARERSRASACVNNLRQIESAKNQYALEEGVEDDGAFAGDFADYIAGGEPTCPLGDAAYTINAIGVVPVCPNYDVDTHPAQL